MKELFRYSSIMIQSGLCITSESLNTIDMTIIFTYIFFSSMSNYLMFSIRSNKAYAVWSSVLYKVPFFVWSLINGINVSCFLSDTGNVMPFPL